MDQHPYCLQCLTTTHDSGQCGFCKAICFSVYSCRLGIVGDALQANKWPQGWRTQLLKCEDTVWSSTQQHNDGHESPASSHEDDQVDTETHVKVHIPTDDQWKSAMETTIAGLGGSMKKITESLQSLSNTGSTGRNRKAKIAPPK